MPLADGTYRLQVSDPAASRCHAPSLQGVMLTVKGTKAWMIVPQGDNAFGGKATRIGNAFVINTTFTLKQTPYPPTIDILGSVASNGSISGVYHFDGVNAGGQTGYACHFKFKAQLDKPVCDGHHFLMDVGEVDEPPVVDSIKCIGSWAVVKWKANAHEPARTFLYVWFTYDGSQANAGWTTVATGRSTTVCRWNVVPNEFHQRACTAS